MSALKFKEKELRNSVLTVRIPASVLDKLRTIADDYERSQSVVIERLIEEAFEKHTKPKGKKSVR